MRQKFFIHHFLIYISVMLLILIGCCSCNHTSVSHASNTGKQNLNASGKEEGTRDNTPYILTPEASGDTVYENEYASIDASHTDQGYVMIHYLGSIEKVKVQIISSGEEAYTYLLNQDCEWNTFPFSMGSGNYTVRVLENIGGDSYAIALTQDITVSLSDDFLPFLYPNQYVNYSANSQAVAKAKELASSADTDLDVVSNIYHYIIQNISYDTNKAETVTYGYTPDIDDTLATGKGICFDYAALMTAMLRTQHIPTRLEVGYSGEAYHAWISTYIKDIGWIDNIIEFDGNEWKLMDPTLAAENSEEAAEKYIGDGSNYTVKYYY